MKTEKKQEISRGSFFYRQRGLSAKTGRVLSGTSWSENPDIDNSLGYEKRHKILEEMSYNARPDTAAADI